MDNITLKNIHNNNVKQEEKMNKVLRVTIERESWAPIERFRFWGWTIESEKIQGTKILGMKLRNFLRFESEMKFLGLRV